MDWIQVLYFIGVAFMVITVIALIGMFLYVMYLEMPVRRKPYEEVAEVTRKEGDTIFLVYEKKEYPFQDERMLSLQVGDHVGILVQDTCNRKRRIHRCVTIEDPEFK